MNDPTPINPYASPETSELLIDSGVPDHASCEEIRNAYRQHEGDVRAWGLFFVMIPTLFVMLGIVLNAVTFATDKAQYYGVMGSCYSLVVGALAIYSGLMLRKLHERAMVPTGILTVLLFLIPGWGTAVCLYTCYLVFSAKGRFVFSPRYRDVIRQTPHLECEVSIGSNLIVLVLFMGLVLLPALLSQ